MSKAAATRPETIGVLPASLERQRVRYSFPVALLIVALFAGLLHIAPLWRAQSQTPAGWTFTGNLTGSPDVMQYRLLTRRAEKIGPIVDNRLTTEPNSPHIPLYFYYVLGKVSSWLQVPFPFVYQYSGIVFAFVLALMLFWTVEHFVESRYQTWWVFLVLLFGGGLGAHLVLLSQIGPLSKSFLIKRIVVDGLQNSIVFDYYRNHYIVRTLFDSHFLFFLIVAMLTVASFYFAVKEFSYLRLLFAAFWFGIGTVLHVYEGITFLFIGMGVTFVLWRKGYPLRGALFTLAACTVSVGAATFWQISLYHSSGILVPAWRAQSIYFSELILAYPLAWALIVWGLGDYWRKAGFKECFLLGWVLGCTLLTLSGPFYPYPDRGTLTLQVPLYIIGGAIFFANNSKVRLPAMLLALFVLGATPAFALRAVWMNSSFSSHPSGAPPAYLWMSPEHREMAELVSDRGTENDVLLVDRSNVEWRTDDLWLAPGFDGKLYCGHVGLTIDYDRKREETNKFFAGGTPSERAQFLHKAGIRYVYVSAKQNPAQFEQVPGLVMLRTNTVGALFEYVE